MSTLTDISTAYGTLTLDTSRDAKMAQALHRGEYPNEPLLRLLRAILTSSATIVDAGAHVGTFAVPAGAIGAKVIAFEPSAESFALLSRNTGTAQGSFRLINKGLGREAGSASLVARNEANAGANTLAPGGDIVVSTLDAEVESADFIKIDVEGMELMVLEGARELLRRSRPLVFFEVNLSQLRAHGTSPRAIERFFASQKYDLYIPLEQGSKVVLARVPSATLMTALIAPRAWALHQSSAPYDLLAVPHERALSVPKAGFGRAVRYALKENVTSKLKRARRLFS